MAKPPDWKTALKCYVFQRTIACGEDFDDSRRALVRTVLRNPGSATAWISFLNKEEASAPQDSTGEDTRTVGGHQLVTLAHLYSWATKTVTGREETKGPLYWDLYIGYARCLWSDNLRALPRKLFKDLISTSKGRYAPVFLEFASLEHQSGDVHRALAILEEGLNRGAQPRELLETTKSEMGDGCFSYRPWTSARDRNIGWNRDSSVEHKAVNGNQLPLQETAEHVALQSLDNSNCDSGSDRQLYKHRDSHETGNLSENPVTSGQTSGEYSVHRLGQMMGRASSGTSDQATGFTTTASSIFVKHPSVVRARLRCFGGAQRQPFDTGEGETATKRADLKRTMERVAESLPVSACNNETKQTTKRWKLGTNDTCGAGAQSLETGRSVWPVTPACQPQPRVLNKSTGQFDMAPESMDQRGLVPQLDCSEQLGGAKICMGQPGAVGIEPVAEGRTGQDEEHNVKDGARTAEGTATVDLKTAAELVKTGWQNGCEATSQTIQDSCRMHTQTSTGNSTQSKDENVTSHGKAAMEPSCLDGQKQRVAKTAAGSDLAKSASPLNGRSNTAENRVEMCDPEVTDAGSHKERPASNRSTKGALHHTTTPDGVPGAGSCQGPVHAAEFLKPPSAEARQHHTATADQSVGPRVLKGTSQTPLGPLSNTPQRHKESVPAVQVKKDISLKSGGTAELSLADVVETGRAPESGGMVYVKGKKYCKLEWLGKGAFSKVYKVLEPGSFFICALKRCSVSNGDPEVAKHVLEEVRLLEQLRGKPRIVQLIDYQYYKQAGVIYILEELGEIDLAGLLQNHEGLRRAEGNMEPDWCFIRSMWKQMVEAVMTIHEARIVHSDLKPANFLVVKGALKLIDFNVARAIQDQTTSIQREQQCGTLNYMAPETLMSSRKVGRPSDIWSLGCILYQMVYSRTPFQHITNNYAKATAITDPDTCIDYPACGDDEVIRLMQSCLTFEAAQRITLEDILEHPFINPNRRPEPLISTPELSKLHSMIKEALVQVAATPLTADVEQLSKHMIAQFRQGKALDVAELKGLARQGSQLDAAATTPPSAVQCAEDCGKGCERSNESHVDLRGDLKSFHFGNNDSGGKENRPELS